jgi:membrane peptidoglycan carboxypeptidase
MKRTITSGTARGAQTYDGTQMFAKTGTTDEAEQIWLVGSSTRVATSYWQGNTDGRKLNLRHFSNGVNGTYAGVRADVWRQAQTPVNAAYPAGAFTDPSSTSIRGNSIQVPDVTGKSAADARATLAGAGLTYVDGGTQPGAGQPGSVSSTSPGPGSYLSRGSSVTVYTTDGSQTTVPNLPGKSLQDARAELGQAGFTNVTILDEFAKGDDSTRCKVAAVAPSPGTATSKDTAVTVKIYGDKDGKAPKDCK